MKKLAIFDYHGTLVWALDVHDLAFRKTVKELYDVEGSIYDVIFSASTIQSVVKGIARARGVLEKKIKEKEDFILRVYEKNFVKCLNENGDKIRILPGIPDLLNLLIEDNFVLSLYSGESKNSLKVILSKTGLYDYFDENLIVPASKKIPILGRKELLEYAIENAEKKIRSEIPNKNIFLFDDSKKAIMAGKELKIITIAVSTGPDDYDELSRLKPDFLFKNFGNPEEIMNKLKYFK